jgi:hypothetical protein
LGFADITALRASTASKTPGIWPHWVRKKWRGLHL